MSVDDRNQRSGGIKRKYQDSKNDRRAFQKGKNLFYKKEKNLGIYSTTYGPYRNNVTFVERHTQDTSNISQYI